jgi:hypothetical protein
VIESAHRVIASFSAARMNHYDTLGVARNATQSEIETAYLRKKGIPHSKQPLYTSGLWDATDYAFDALHDPLRRERYDAELHYEEMNPLGKALINALGFIIDGEFLDIPIIRIILLCGVAVLLLWILITTFRYFWTHPLF